MSLFVLDTDILSLYYRGEANVVRNIDSRGYSELAISVITVDEQLTGWYTLTRKARQSKELAQAYARLADAVVHLAQWRILPYTESAIARVAQLKGTFLKGQRPCRARCGSLTRR
jgi:tRNA(fMet)-specific endonuclease VapC